MRETKKITIPVNVWYERERIHLTTNRNVKHDDGTPWPSLSTSVRVDTAAGQQFARLLRAAGKPAGPEDATRKGDVAS